MESISVFHMLKIGVGPSSSHTLGPWRAAEQFVAELDKAALFDRTVRIHVDLYGSLALTGKGHGTDKAILLGLCGDDPVTITDERLRQLPAEVARCQSLRLAGRREMAFDPATDIEFHPREMLPYHANGMRFAARGESGRTLHESIYYSVGGGFVVKDGAPSAAGEIALRFPIHTAGDLLQHCVASDASIWQIVLENEKAWRPPDEIKAGLLRIWEVMKEAVYRGCHVEGTLPGGLQVNRRAAGIHRQLLTNCDYQNADEWIACIRQRSYDFAAVTNWVSCFAMAVNEENANFGRIVTAPTNGAAGVIPAVLMYCLCFADQPPTDDEIVQFLLTASQIGILFKKGATISAAMGGCQAEIGVSAAMAAAALAEHLGGSVGQVMMAAEIAMEHHLGMTCDPVGGLVQVPCIERNSMGAIKAITAANLALAGNPEQAKVSLDAVIRTMWATAQDMSHKYKETSQGGLAASVSIRLPEC